MTGAYTFWISGDDNVALYFSQQGGPENKARIAYHNSYSGQYEWNKFATQKSVSLSLVAGTKYYIEALMKESSGNDYFAVGWLLPGQTGNVPSEVIPGRQLSPFQAAGSNNCTSTALNRVAAVASSVESSSHPASHAIDGNSSTRWSSAFSDPQWLQVDLGAVKHVSRVKLTWEAAASANYDIQVSNDNATWTTIFTDTHANGGTDDITGLSATGRYVRMYSRARTTTYGNSLFEVEVFGESNQACNPVLGERLDTGAPSATSSGCSIGPAPGRLGALASVLGSIGALGVAWRRSRRRLARRAQGATRRT